MRVTRKAAQEHILQHAEEYREKIRAGVTVLPSGCWLWNGAYRETYSGKRGYLLSCGRRVTTHRASHLAFKGPVPDKLNVLHSCDTPLCCAPDHVYAGTQKRNIADCVERGRHVSTGEGGRKLDLRRVQAIRILSAAGFSASELGVFFGVSRTTATRVANGSAWAKLPGKKTREAAELLSKELALDSALLLGD